MFCFHCILIKLWHGSVILIHNTNGGTCFSLKVGALVSVKLLFLGVEEREREGMLREV